MLIVGQELLPRPTCFWSWWLMYQSCKPVKQGSLGSLGACKVMIMSHGHLELQ